MNQNLKPSSIAPILGVINPASYAAGTQATSWLSMKDIGSIEAIVMAGALGTNATLDFKLQQATDSSGTSAKDITGKAITQLTQAGTDSNKQAVINCFPEDLDVNNSFTHVRALMTVATAASVAGALIKGYNARYEPLDDATTVDEIVG